MPVSRLLDGAKLIEQQKGIRIAGKSRISQFTDFARMIMERYLVKSVYEFSSASFVFADWFHEEQDSREKKELERELVRIIRMIREFQRGKHLPVVHQQLIRQLNQTTVLYENRLDGKSKELLALCREVIKQGNKAAEYLQEPELEKRLSQVMLQLARPGRTQVFTGRFSPDLENHVRTAGRMPSYRERFLKAKKESTEHFRQVYTERMPMIRFMERLSQEEKKQIQTLFPTVFREDRELVNVLTSMSGVQWREWKEQVLQMVFPEKPAAQIYRDQSQVYRDQVQTYRDQSQVYRGQGQAYRDQAERVFLELLSSGEKMERLQPAYQKTKERIWEDIVQNRLPDLMFDHLAAEFAGEILEPEGNHNLQSAVSAYLKEDADNGMSVIHIPSRTDFLRKNGADGSEKRADRTAESELPEVLEDMVRQAGWKMQGEHADPERTAQSEDAGADAAPLKQPEERTKALHLGWIAEKIALMLTISEVTDIWEKDSEKIVPELTELLNAPGAGWEEAKTVLLHREPGTVYREWKLWLDKTAGLETDEAEDEKLQHLMSILQVLMKEPSFRYLAEQVMSQAKLLPKQWKNLTEEQKNEYETWQQIQELHIRKLSDHTTRQQKLEMLHEAIASMDVKEWELLEHKLYERAGSGQNEEARRIQGSDSIRQAGKTWSPGKIQENTAEDIPLVLMHTSFSVEEYQLKKHQISEHILRETGGIPEDMQSVLGKLPLIQMIQSSEETAGYVSQVLYQIPEMEIYTRLWKAQDTGKTPELSAKSEQTVNQQMQEMQMQEMQIQEMQMQEMLVELIETLTPSEWRIVEDRLLHGRIGLPETGSETGQEDISDRAALEYRNREMFLLTEQEEAEKEGAEKKTWFNSSDAALDRLKLPAASALEFLDLFIHNTYDRNLQVYAQEEPGKRFGSGIQPRLDTAAGHSDYIFVAGRSRAMLRDSGIFMAEKNVPGEHVSGEDDRYVFLFPLPDRVIARPLPPRQVPAPVQDAEKQLEQMREQTTEETAKKDISVVQVMKNQARTVNEYEERLTKLTENLAAQKAEIEELMQSQRQINDPRMQQRMIERVIRQLGRQLRLERMQRGKD